MFEKKKFKIQFQMDDTYCQTHSEPPVRTTNRAHSFHYITDQCAKGTEHCFSTPSRKPAIPLALTFQISVLKHPIHEIIKPAKN